LWIRKIEGWHNNFNKFWMQNFGLFKAGRAKGSSRFLWPCAAIPKEHEKLTLKNNKRINSTSIASFCHTIFETCWMLVWAQKIQQRRRQWEITYNYNDYCLFFMSNKCEKGDRTKELNVLSARNRKWEKERNIWLGIFN
jgi:hypothetical protein